MTKYEVIKDFSDLQDRGIVYRVGDSFPRKGKEAADKRIQELLGADNKRKEVLIKEVLVEDEKEQGENENSDEYPIHTGGGYYQLSNGEKVQGKDAAIEAEKALKE